MWDSELDEEYILSHYWMKGLVLKIEELVPDYYADIQSIVHKVQLGLEVDLDSRTQCIAESTLKSWESIQLSLDAATNSVAAGKDIDDPGLSSIAEMKRCFREDSEFRSKMENAAAHLAALERLFKVAAISPFDCRYFACDSLIQNVRGVTIMILAARDDFWLLTGIFRRDGVTRMSLFRWRMFLNAVKALKATHEDNGRKLVDLILKPSHRVRLEHHQ